VLLYILAFKDEPLIKIGITRNISCRLVQLGGRFDLNKSYAVTATDENCVKLLERNLRAIFAEQRASATIALSSGNTEIYDAAILPKVLPSINVFKDFFAHAASRIEAGVDPTPKRLRQKASCTPTNTQQLLDKLPQFCAERGHQSAVAREVGVSRQRVNDWLHGRKHPSLEQGLALLQLLERL
jgi:hypothetical protein